MLLLCVAPSSRQSTENGSMYCNYNILMRLILQSTAYNGQNIVLCKQIGRQVLEVSMRQTHARVWLPVCM